jgi:hypothetical protein
MLIRFSQTLSGFTGKTYYGATDDTAWVTESPNPHEATQLHALIEKLIDDGSSFAVITGALRSALKQAPAGGVALVQSIDDDTIKYLIIGNGTIDINGTVYTAKNQTYATGSTRTHGYSTEITLLTSAIKSCYTPSEPIEDLLKKFAHTTTLHPQNKDTGYSILVLQI